MFSFFFLLIYCCVASTLNLDLSTVLNIFRAEVLSGYQLEFSILGSVTCEGLQSRLHNYALQIACTSSWENGLDFSLFQRFERMTRATGRSQIIFMAPTSVEDFVHILSNMSVYLKTVPIPNVNCRRIFFINWPQEGNDSAVVKTALEKRAGVSKSISKIRQFQEIYATVWTRTSEGSHALLDVIEIYAIRGKIPVIRPVLEWKHREALVLSSSQGKLVEVDAVELLRIAERRKNFEGSTILVLGQPDAAFEAELTVEISHNHVRFVSGRALNILKDFQTVLNFTYKPVLGKGWIGLDSSGKELTGFGEQMKRKEADIAISLSELEEYVAKELRYLPPVRNYQCYAFFKQPAVSSARNVFIMPFEKPLWGAIFLVLLLLLNCGCIILWREWCLSQNQQRVSNVGPSPCTHLPELSEFSMWALAIQCQTGWSFAASNNSSFRVVCVLILLYSVIVYSFYTSSVVAYTSFPTKPIQNVEHLWMRGFQIFTDPDRPDSANAFAPADEDRHAVLNLSGKLYGNLSQAVQKVVEVPNTALIIGLTDFYSTGIDEFSDHQLCAVDKLKAANTARMKEAMIVRRSGSFKEFFGHRQVSFIERGLADLSEKRYRTQVELRCLMPSLVTFELDMLEVYSAFVLLFMSYVISIVIVFVERRWNRRLETNTQSILR